MNGSVRYCPGPVARRSFLQIGALGLGGFGLADWLRLQAQAGTTAATSGTASADDPAVIFIWLPGGPPHLETFDLKPDAPAEYRGIFSPIPTNVPGIDICELLPLHARTAHRFSLIRSIAHNFADHGGGHKRFLTGRDPREPTGFVNDYPAVGSMVAKMRERVQRGVPNYVVGTDSGRQGIDTYSFGSAYLGAATHPFMVVGNPNAADFQVQNLSLDPRWADRLDDRRALLASFDRLQNDLDGRGTMQAMDTFNRRAVELLTSDRARRAFDLSAEPQALRDRYGRHAWGQRALMARRLVEAGSTFVTMVFENPMPGQAFPTDVTYNWDSHAVNCHIFTDLKLKLPMLDQAVTALIDDLYQRGLDRRVLLVVTGEFGRTPRINSAQGRPGRDHWPSAMSVLVSGGGLQMGRVVGSTTAKGEQPKDYRLSPNDLWATVFRHLRIDTSQAFLDHAGRPMPLLPYGDPIKELI